MSYYHVSPWLTARPIQQQRLPLPLPTSPPNHCSSIDATNVCEPPPPTKTSFFQGAITFLRLLISGRHRRILFVVFRTSSYSLRVFPSFVASFLINPPLPISSTPLHPSPHLSILLYPPPPHCPALPFLLCAATEALRRHILVGQAFAFR